MSRLLIPSLGLLLVIQGCSVSMKVGSVSTREGASRVSISTPGQSRRDKVGENPGFDGDLLSYGAPSSGSSILMESEITPDGERIAHDILAPSHISTSYRNVAERNGKIPLVFDITVPRQFMGRSYRVRMTPWIVAQGDSIPLDPIYISGDKYRRTQLRGYQRYNRFVESIITDTTRFINLDQLEVFLRRNLPEVYAFKGDTTFVSDEAFRSAFGVTGPEAVRHYTYWTRVRRNKRKILALEEMRRRYIPSPILSEGIRLDTVLTNPDGDFVYRYRQVLSSSSSLRRIDVRLSGEIDDGNKTVRRIPQTRPISFYVTTLGSLYDPTERFSTRIVGRDISRRDVCSIIFPKGKDWIEMDLASNRSELERIVATMKELSGDPSYEVDSVLVRASCSPEGSWEANTLLAQRRSQSIRRYLDSRKSEWEDGQIRQVSIRTLSSPENWEALDSLVQQNRFLSSQDKDAYSRVRSLSNPDLREHELSRLPFYPRLRDQLYPALRTVRFDFHMHSLAERKDTITTRILDENYHDGLLALLGRDYQKAVSILSPYEDYNSALAYAATGNDSSAMLILGRIKEESARKEYLLAILESRSGKSVEAREHFQRACVLDERFSARGRLDPEIVSLGLFKDTENSPRQ